MCTERCKNCPNRRIAARSGVIADALPALGTVVSATANDAALLSHTGEYAPPAHPGEALTCGQDRISVRMNPELAAVVSPRALTLVAGFGTHRAYLTPNSDQLVYQGLSLASAGEEIEFTPVDWTSVDWSRTDQIDHLDSLTGQRYQVLPFTGARQIEPRVLPHLLAYLVEQSIEFTVAVPGGGCVQMHKGRAAMADGSSRHFAVIFGAARYAVDPLQVRECWVTQVHGASGLTSAVEMYDHRLRCVTVLTLTGSVCGHTYEAWEAIAASLPAA